MKVLPVGPKRESLDKLLLERLYSNAKDKADQCMSTMMNLPPLRIEQSFASITVIAFHISRRITYAINLTNANDRSEQQADLTLRLINLGYPGIEAALFRVLGNEMQPLKPPDRAWLLCQDAHSREMFLSELFNFEKSIGTLQFVRETVLPAWDGAHRKWLSTLDQSLIEYVDSCDPKFTQRRGSEVRRKKFIKWSIWADPRRIRLIKRLGKWLRKQESRIENR
jgi:hypothetical protein